MTPAATDGPRYRLADWTPGFGVDEAQWVAQLAAQGWVPWPDAASTPARVEVNGRVLHRWSLVWWQR